MFVKGVKALFFTSVATLLLYLSQFLTVWTPLPLFHLALSKKTSQRFWFLIWGITFFLALAIYGFFAPFLFFEIGYFLYFLAIAFFLSFGSWKKWSLTRLGLWIAFFIPAAIVVLFLVLDHFHFFDLESYFQSFVASVQSQLQMALEKKYSQDRRQELLLLGRQMKKWIEFSPKLIPTFLFIFTIIIMGLNIFLVRLFKPGKAWYWAGAFQRLQLPFSCIWWVIGSGALFFSNYYWFSLPWLTIVSLNIFISFAFVYLLQGFSVFSFFVRRFSPLFRFGIYGFIFLFLQLVGVVMVGVGLADMWVDFRRLRLKS